MLNPNQVYSSVKISYSYNINHSYVIEEIKTVLGDLMHETEKIN